MRWKDLNRSKNVVDNRRSGGGNRTLIGGGIGTIIVVIIGLLMGQNPLELINQVGVNSAQTSTYEPSAAENELADFVTVVLGQTEEVWNDIFKQNGMTYKEPQLELFTGQVSTACGSASSAVGPFYCPDDYKVYIDLSFMDELANRFKAGGDFAQAYVVAHEVGHHVQNLLGTSAKVQNMRGKVSEKEYNRLSVRLELQADFYAGIWAHYAHKKNQIIEPGDVEEALRAAHAIGDDMIQKQTQGHIVPDAFTHGSSQQRMYWFKLGLETGDLSKGDTFSSDI